MRLFRIMTHTALLAGLGLTPYLAAEENAGPRANTAETQEHAAGPRVHCCDTDKDRDDLRDQVKRLGDRERGEFLEKLRHFMAERKERLDHLCDQIRNHPKLSEERKKELLAIINEKREEMHERMKEFIEEHKDKMEERRDKIEQHKLGERVDDLRDFIRSHPCLSDAQKDRLKDKLADLKDDRQDQRQDNRDDDRNGPGEHHDGNGAQNGGDSALSSEQKDQLRAKMLGMKNAAAGAGDPTCCDRTNDRKDLHDDRKDLAGDLKDLHQDVKDLHQDQRDLKQDLADGDKKDVVADKKDIHDDRQDIAGDRQDIRSDVRDIRQDGGPRPGGRPVLSDEQKDRMRAKVADIKDARQNGDGDGEGRPVLSDEQRDRVKARLDQARDNRGEGPGTHTPMPGQRNDGDRGNNGLGNGEDGQPRGNPKMNDGAGAGPGHPGARPGK